MYELEKISHYTTVDSATVFWYKPDGVPQDAYYVVQMGDRTAKTSKTHCCVSGLQPDHDYAVTVKLFSKEDQLLAEQDWGKVHTQKIKNRVDITSAPFSAVGDGETLNTYAIQKAIDACGEMDILYIPAGVFLTGALRLHSNMEMYLEEGAVLQGTSCPEDYLPRIWSRFEGTELSCYSSVLNMGELDSKGGYNCHNILIHGKGTIASGGELLAQRVIDSEREALREFLLAQGDKIKEYENADTVPGRVRPRLINMSNCQNVVLSGLTFQNGASWNVHMIYSDSVVTNGCTFLSEGVHNGDGWDPDSSSNCTIFDCLFLTGDDSVAIKSGKNPEGNRINRPCEHIRIFDCISKYGHGITIGSEMSGGVNDVRIWDCDIAESYYGIEIKATKKRGGYVRNVHVENCSLPRILFHSVGYNDDGIGAGVAPVFENCCFENISVKGRFLTKERQWQLCDAVELCGFDEPGHELKNVTMRNLVIGTEEISQSHRISLKFCKGITFENITCV